jgi:hypothetical protein
MTIVAKVLADADAVLLWGLAATIVMTTVMQGSQQFGFSRLSLPFLLGTMLTGNRRLAVLLGYVLYTIGGWLFAFLYFGLFVSAGIATWWFGALLGLVHGLFVITVLLTVLAHIHPRMATEYSGPNRLRVIEPPGFMALNYGIQTPVFTVLAQTLYGVILGAGLTV